MVEASFLDIPGLEVSPESLLRTGSRSFAEVCGSDRMPFVDVVRYLQSESYEAVVADVQVERPTHARYDIRSVERLAILFRDDQSRAPEVLALREDFPVVPHLNLRTEELPRSLCLFDQTFDELKMSWTVTRFVKRIQQWLNLTARGELHAQDQGLEPLLEGSPIKIVLPHWLWDTNSGKLQERLRISRLESTDVLIAESAMNPPPQTGGQPYAGWVIVGQPQLHGFIHRNPTNLLELHVLVSVAGIDLIGVVRQRLLSLESGSDLHDAYLALILHLPKMRGIGATPESTDVWAFVTQKTLSEIGQGLGIWQCSANPRGGTHRAILLQVDDNLRGQDIPLQICNPVQSFSPDYAAELNGCEREEKTIVAVGQGALGSQVILNLIRMGYGQWALVDQDILLPHNLARHALPGPAVGWSKAWAVSILAKQLFAEGDLLCDAIQADIMSSTAAEPPLRDTIQRAGVILDFSASVPVSRHLALDVGSEARRLSAFLSPSGRDSVLLAEDGMREVKLDHLEMQYYRRLISDARYENHFAPSDGVVRYANSCNDVTSRIPQDLVALHAGVMTRAIRGVLADANPAIMVWQTDSVGMAVVHDAVPVSAPVCFEVGYWTVCTDDWVLNSVANRRLQKLPRETGGVLIGCFDLQRHIVYVVDTIPSPPDSTEWPTVYIRGCTGLEARVKEIQRLTAYGLEYVGEWHSHPENCSTMLSAEDRDAFEWLSDYMSSEGLPALMLIAGDHGQRNWYLGDVQ